jgi:hypothetical protein
MEVLRKKISTFRGEGGRVRIKDETLLLEILSAWEQWTGPAKSFYPAIGVSQKGMASVIGKAKKLRREGHFAAEEFKPVQVLDPAAIAPLTSGCGIELVWDGGRVIRFSQVEQLTAFLKAAA